MIKETVLQACRRMLGPIVRLLLRNGVTWREFADLGKEVFVEVARADYGLQGRPTNTSRVALMTGFSRREVMRIKNTLLGKRSAAEPVQSRISEVLTGWHTDPEFLAADGLPAILPARGPGSVEALLKRYAGDHPHGAFLKELKQLGLLSETPAGWHVKSRHYLRSPADPDIVRQLGVALHDHAATLVHNADARRTTLARFEGMATGRLSATAAKEFRDYVEREGQAFLERADAWIAAHERQSENPSPIGGNSNARTGVGVYLIDNDT